MTAVPNRTSIHPANRLGWLRTGIALALLLVAPPLLGRERGVIVVPIDIDGDALRRTDPVTKLVVDLLGKALSDRNIRLVKNDWYDRRQRLGHRNVMSAHDWAREAKRSRVEIDDMIALKVYEYGDHRGDGRALRVEIRTRLYSFPGERLLHETSVTTRASTAVPPDCDRDCVAAAVTSAVEVVAPMLAEDLVSHMPHDRRGAQTKRLVEVGEDREYTIDLEGFDETTLQRIDDYLRVFSGFISREIIERNLCRQRITYRTRISRGKLEQNMRRMFRELHQADVRLRFETLRVQAVRPGCR